MKIYVKIMFVIMPIIILYTIFLQIKYNSASNYYFKLHSKTFKDNFILKDKFSKSTFNLSHYKDSLSLSKMQIDSLKNQLNTPDYIRYKIWKKTDILIFQSFSDKYLMLMWNGCLERHIPIEIMVKLLYKESCFNNKALSTKGAYGYCQIMPTIYKEYNTSDLKHLSESEKNLLIGMDYLNNLHEIWKAKKKGYKEIYIWKLTLASYNCGLYKVQKYDGIPPIQETKDYIKFIFE